MNDRTPEVPNWGGVPTTAREREEYAAYLRDAYPGAAAVASRADLRPQFSVFFADAPIMFQRLRIEGVKCRLNMG